jgi:hypothetical protein
MSAASDPKRVFMTMGDSSDFLKKPEKNAGTTGSKSKTLRLDLGLFEPDEYKFPEFNYQKLVHIEKVIIWTVFFLIPSSSSCDCEGEEEEKEKNPFLCSVYNCVARCLHLSYDC